VVELALRIRPSVVGDRSMTGAQLKELEKSTTEEMLVSVVLPCLNEAEGVGPCVEQALRTIHGMGCKGEVVVVDNGSTDGSAEIAMGAGARVVREERRGYGSAYLRGFAEAKGKYLVMADADGTYDLTDLPKFIAPLESGKYDLVMGNRFGGLMEPGAMSWSHRRIGNPILSGLLRLMFHTSVADSHCGMRAFTREAYKRMSPQTEGMEFASELVVNALRENLRIHEEAIPYSVRAGESKLNGPRDAWRHVRFMLLYSPSYLFLLPGMLFIMVGLGLSLLMAGGPREIFGREWDFHALLFGILALILGYNLVLLDLFAKTFSMEAGLAPAGRWLRRFSNLFSLERGVMIGAVLCLAGFLLELKIVTDWARTGFGTLMAVRGVAIGMAAILIGAQTVFASFLLSLLQLHRRRS
jgi:glycosyltransferase involved in cell wall biosynthesis